MSNPPDGKSSRLSVALPCRRTVSCIGRVRSRHLSMKCRWQRCWRSGELSSLRHSITVRRQTWCRACCWFWHPTTQQQNNNSNQTYILFPLILWHYIQILIYLLKLSSYAFVRIIINMNNYDTDMEINSRWIPRIKLSLLHSNHISNNSKEL